MIQVTGLTKSYGSTVAVEDLTFSVAAGKVTGFLGPNGAGKSTTMRMILGLDQPTSGTARIANTRYRDLVRPLRSVGALLSAHDVHPARSARAHLLAMARSNAIPSRRVEQVLTEVGLMPAAGRRTGGYSLGMLQRLGIAGALLGDPPVLIFDEPLNGLDPEGVRWVRDLLRSLAAEGRTVLVSSHLMSEMQLTADHLVIIGRGRLVADLPLAELIASSDRATVQVRVPEPAHRRRLTTHLTDRHAEVTVCGAELLVRGLSVDQVGDAAYKLGVRLRTLQARDTSLEDAYLELTANRVEYGART